MIAADFKLTYSDVTQDGLFLSKQLIKFIDPSKIERTKLEFEIRS